MPWTHWPTAKLARTEVGWPATALSALIMVAGVLVLHEDLDIDRSWF